MVFFYPMLCCRRSNAYDYLRRVPSLASPRGIGIRWNSIKHGIRPGRHLLTLRPSEMIRLEQEAYDLSNKKRAAFRTLGRHDGTLSYVMSYICGDNSKYNLPFPRGTRGVVYYHHEQGRPPLSCEIRFRLCEGASSFEEGRDLFLPNGKGRWKVPLYTIARGKKSFSALRYLLASEKLVDQQILDDLSKQGSLLPYKNTHALYEIGEPFVVDLSQQSIALTFVNQHTKQKIKIRPFSHHGPGDSLWSPYTGKARIRFVLSTRPQDEGRRVYNLEFLEMITPVECVVPGYDYSIREPRAGELLHVRNPISKDTDLKPWCFDVLKRADGWKLVKFLDSNREKGGQSKGE